MLITGSSAGGIATIIWTNYLRSIVKNPENVVAAPDSGALMIFENMKTKTELFTPFVINNFKLGNIEEKTPL